MKAQKRTRALKFEPSDTILVAQREGIVTYIYPADIFLYVFVRIHIKILFKCIKCS